MSPENRARVAFVIVLLALAAAAAGAFLFMQRGKNFYELRTRDSVSGLIRGAPVEFHGVEVGKVDRVELVDAHNVRIVVEVDGHVPLTTATVATITGRGLATRGFTGYVYVSLEDSGADARPLAIASGGEYPMIATARSQTVSLDTSISELNENMQAVTALLRTTLDARTVASLKESIAGLDAVTRTLAGNNQRLQSILANAERASAQMPPLVQSGAQTLRTMQVELLPQAGRTFVHMEGVIGSGQEALQTMRTQLLPQAQQSLVRLDDVTGSLADTAEHIRRDPGVLLRGPRRAPGPGEAQ